MNLIMDFIRHTTITDNFLKSWEIYEKNFPFYEKRTLEEQKRVLNDNSYFANSINEKNNLIGLLYYWEFKDYIFIEHLAIDSFYQGKSLGSEVIKNLLKKHKSIFLEIEPVVDITTKRRLKFYEKLGFIENDFEHFQVPFRKAQKKNTIDFIIL